MKEFGSYFFGLVFISCQWIYGQPGSGNLPLVYSDVFVSGTEGYHTFRIPAIIQAKNGNLIAFAEGRKGGRSDTGNIDLVMKISKDRGISWGPLNLVWEDGGNTCGNPAPVLDDQSGQIFLLTTWNLGKDHEGDIINGSSVDTRRIFLIHSKDHGNSWSDPKEITNHVKQKNWSWYATGPGSGMQIRSGIHKGRMVLGCDHIEKGTKKYFSHLIYSDDFGHSWNLGGSSPHDQVNECEVAELPGGTLMLNMRNYDRSKKSRQIALSLDGGLTWQSQRHDEQLIEPICQASLQTHPAYHLLLFSNPASEEARENMTLRFSLDWGYSWSKSITLHKGPSAYSDLVVLDDKNIGCLFESGTKNPYEKIVFVNIGMN